MKSPEEGPQTETPHSSSPHEIYTLNLHFDAIECIIMTLGCPPEGVLDTSLIKVAFTHEDTLDR